MHHDLAHRPLVAVALLGLISTGTSACKDDDRGDESADEAGTDDDDDTDDDTEGDNDETAETGNELEWSFAPVYGSANLDDDDEDGTRDWLQPEFEGDNEVYPFTIPAALTEAMAGEGEQVRLTLSGDLDQLRLWHEGAHVLGSGNGEPKPSYTFTPSSAEAVLPVEFGDYLARGELLIERLASDGSSVLDSAVVELVAAPLIMNQHLQAAEHLWVIETSDNANFVAGFEAALGSDVTASPGGSYQQDRWLQDEIEFGYGTDPAGGRLDVVIDSIRDRGLDPFAENNFTMPNWVIGAWGNPINATSFDSFGNLDATPPVPGYPFGRIYYGLEGPDGLDSVLADFLASQTLQAPFAVDSAWLCVGHVDEFSSFVADPSAPNGFRLLIADSTAAYALIDGLDPSWDIGRYDNAYGYATAGELAADAGLRALNEDIQQNELDPLRARFVAELGLTDEEIIEIPTVFEQLQGCGPYMVALTPGTVNLIVANLAGQPNKLLVPDPFFRADGMGPDSDPIAQDFVDRMPDGLEVVFIDDWYSYHLLDGEVHCGTNVTRTPALDWWTDGAALLGLEGGN
jgi:hypothetical protein